MNAVYRDTYSRSSNTSGSVVAVRSRGSLHTRKANDDMLKQLSNHVI